MNKFYNYIYLDPRKPGLYIYGLYKFEYEPFYVGKGKSKRYLDHLKYDKRNPLKTNIINKIINSGFDLKQYIVILHENISEDEAFHNEINLINIIGRRIDNLGPLSNMDLGGIGSDTISNHPNKKNIFEKIKKTQIENKSTHKGKTYEELYGDRANEEKEKRRKALLGKKFSKERIKKCSEAHKNSIPWNKGLTKSDVRIKKYVENRIPYKYLKHYKIKNLNTNEEIESFGRLGIEKYIKQYNKNKKRGDWINLIILLREMKYKNFIVLIKEKNYGY